MLEFHNDDNDARVRIHGNGFLQAELPNGDKLHVWADDCPRQEQPTLIHNHNSAFVSHILLGALSNVEYELEGIHSKVDDEIYDILEAVPRQEKDTLLVARPGQYYIKSRRSFCMTAGSVYEFPGTASLFHSTHPLNSLVVTSVTRVDDKSDRNTMILVPMGKTPDNEFNRYDHQDYAIDLYRRVKDKLER